MNKVKINVVKEEKIDNRVNNTGRPINKSAVGGHVCNVNYIGRTKVLGYTYVLNKRVNVEINLKEVNFQK